MNESTLVIGVKGPSVRVCWASVGLLRYNEEDGGDESEETRTSSRARDECEDRGRTDVRAAMEYLDENPRRRRRSKKLSAKDSGRGA